MATPTLITLATFDRYRGSGQSELFMDADGDLFSTTDAGGRYDTAKKNTYHGGTVYEIAATETGYAQPATLVSFKEAVVGRISGLVADAEGDLFGTIPESGPDADGRVFEIEKTPTGYANRATAVFSFNSADEATYGACPEGDILVDSAGDLFGQTNLGGTNGTGTVFEIAKTATGYAETPTTLASFGVGDSTYQGLTADSAGDLFGVVGMGGEHDCGFAFEIAKTATGYSGMTTLVSFKGWDGKEPYTGLITDSNGDLFGTTVLGGSFHDGVVFEIVKTADGYASKPTVLTTFGPGGGKHPQGKLIMDADGDLFGTTNTGGVYNQGTVFEIVKTPTGYDSAPLILINFNRENGAGPASGLIADSNGDLFGTTPKGGGEHRGTVFEITGSGFVPFPTGPEQTQELAATLSYGALAASGGVFKLG